MLYLPKLVNIWHFIITWVISLRLQIKLPTNDKTISLMMTLYKIGFLFQSTPYYPVGIYLLKVNDRNTRTRCEICSKLIIKTPERRHSCIYCQLWAYLTPCYIVSIVNFEHAIAGWVYWRCSSTLITSPSLSFIKILGDGG